MSADSPATPTPQNSEDERIEREDELLVCPDCGAVVPTSSKQKHSNFHDDSDRALARMRRR